MMKIGVSTGLFLNTNEDLNNSLEFLEKKVKYVELGCDGNINVMEYHSKNPDVVHSYSLNYTLHCPLSDLNLSSFREKIRKASLDFVEDIVKTADEVNANLVVLHPGYCVFKSDYEKATKSLIKSLNDLNDIQKEYSIKITIENMPSYNMFMFREPTDEIINSLGDLGITFDIGHSFLNNNIEDFLSDGVIEKISHIHIHDNNGEFDEHLCVGKGKIDFEKYMDKIKKINCIKMIEMQNKSFNDLDLCIDNIKKYYR
jgi:sugar phosphate isomerase/epimerase